MFYQMVVLLVPVFVPTLVVKVGCNNNTNDDVIVKYSGHAEANFYPDRTFIVDRKPGVVSERNTEGFTTPTTTNNAVLITATTPSPTPVYEDVTEGVIFVPNEPPVRRLRDEYRSEGETINEILENQNNDMMGGNYRMETESPANGVFFVPGRNNEHKEEVEKKERRIKSGRRSYKEGKEEEEGFPLLDCSNLDCNNTIKSICGAKLVNNNIQYRLFLNDCYFRKVNCNFHYAYNRYTIAPPEKCVSFQPTGEKPFTFTRKYLGKPQKIDLNARKSISSRRSMSMDLYGRFCSHPCPVSCPDDYEPQCAISATGQKRVFMNHCKVDDNSCVFAIVWHLKPLSDCVGGQKADMRHNRHFIGWLRQVGIVDKKGKLVLE